MVPVDLNDTHPASQASMIWGIRARKTGTSASPSPGTARAIFSTSAAAPDLSATHLPPLGHNVTGADPEPAMLDVARSKPHGASVQWVEVTSEGFRPSERFDLIIMTGHAFQVPLTDAQVAEALANMAAHLKPLWLHHIRKPQSGHRLGQRLGPRANAAIAGRHADPRVSPDHRVQPRHRHVDLRVGL